MSKQALRNSTVLLTASIALLTSCTVGPDYVPPAVPQTAAYKESGPWKKAQPQIGRAHV